MKLDLSIVIACYNCENTIIRCLDSIPKDLGIEIILVNDSSTDNTEFVIRQYMNNHLTEDIVLLTNIGNLGAGRTRNKGVSAVTRKYLTFLDSDDEFDASFGEDARMILQADYDCIVFDASYIKGSSNSIIKMFYTEDIREGAVEVKDALVFTRGATWGKIYKTDIIANNNVCFGTTPRNEDLVFTKVAISCCNSIFYLEKALYKYIDNGSSLMHNNELTTEKNAFISMRLIKDILLKKGFEREYNGIYFLEIVYATTLTMLHLGHSPGECNAHFRSVKRDYKKNDIYRKRFNFKYRFAYLLFSANLFFIIKPLIRS